MLSIHTIIGSDPHTIRWWQMAIRALVIFGAAFVLVRFGGARIFGKKTIFDIVLAVMLGSILSRALTANAPFFPTLAAATALVLLHWMLAHLAFRHPRFGKLIKGTEHQLIADGHILRDALRQTTVTETDLMESLRSTHGHTDLQRIKAAYLERSGQISFVEQ